MRYGKPREPGELQKAQAEGLLLKPQVETDREDAGFKDEIKYWGQLLQQLSEGGSEDARKLLDDAVEMIERGGDPEVAAGRFITRLLRYAVVQGYERPVTAANTENFSMRMPVQLLEKIDSAIVAGASPNRSELVRSVLELAFSGVDASQMKYRTALMEVMTILLKNPEEMLLFYVIRRFFARSDVRTVAQMLHSIAGPLTEIIAAVGGEGIERVQEAVGELFETLNTADSESEGLDDGVGDAG